MLLCMPGVYCYSHSISQISDVRLRIKQRRVESRKASRPRAEPLNSLPTSDPAAEKDQERAPGARSLPVRFYRKPLSFPATSNKRPQWTREVPFL